MDVARAVGEKLAGAENLAIAEHIYLADQDIQEVLATRPEGRPDLNVEDQLILSGTGGEVPPLDPTISDAYGERVRAIRMELGRRLAETLSRPQAGTGRLAMLIDNMHLVKDAAVGSADQ